MRPIIIGVALSLGACTTAQPIMTAEGKQGYSIECSGASQTWGACYAQAGYRCGDSGYVILEKSGEEAKAISATQFGLIGSNAMIRNMIIQCK